MLYSHLVYKEKIFVVKESPFLYHFNVQICNGDSNLQAYVPFAKKMRRP